MKEKTMASDQFIHKQLEKLMTNKTALPPLFGEIDNGEIAWKHLQNVDYDSIGKILISHLLIETYITKYIHLRIPKTFDLDNANLTFSKKVILIKNDLNSMPMNFHPGINVINKIRNRYSHNLEGDISSAEIGILKSFLIEYGKYLEANREDENHYTPSALEGASGVAIIESFTNLFCAWLAAACTVLVKYNHDNPTW